MAGPKSKTEILDILSDQGYISLNLLAPLIGLSYPTVHNMKKNGKIQGYLVGSQYRIYPEAIAMLLPPEDMVHQELIRRTLVKVRTASPSTALGSSISPSTHTVEPGTQKDPFAPTGDNVGPDNFGSEHDEDEYV